MSIGRREIVLGLGVGLTALAGCRQGEGAVLPEAELPALPGLVSSLGWPVPGIAADEFRGRVSVLNVWASWCPYCRGEHDVLMELSRDRRFRLVGLVFRDKPAAAAEYLRRAGNPYAAVALDDGRFSAVLGQRGVPATYVVDGGGRVVERMPGALDAGTVKAKLLPAVTAALGRA